MLEKDILRLGSSVGESGIWSETPVAIAMWGSGGIIFQEEENGSAKAERQDKGGVEQEDVAQCGEVEGPDCVGFVGEGEELGFLPSVMFWAGEG